MQNQNQTAISKIRYTHVQAFFLGVLVALALCPIVVFLFTFLQQ